MCLMQCCFDLNLCNSDVKDERGIKLPINRPCIYMYLPIALLDNTRSDT